MELKNIMQGSMRCIRDLRIESRYAPHPGSQTEREIHDGTSLVAEWTRTPVQDCHATPNAQLGSADDYMSMMVASFDAGAVYSPHVLARATLEASARAYELLTPSWDVQTRVLAGMTERLYGLSELARLPIPSAQEYANARITRFCRGAVQLNLTILPATRHQPIAIERRRTSMTNVIKALLDDDDSEAPIGGMLANYLSSVAHSVGPAIIGQLESMGEIPGSPGMRYGRPTLTVAAMISQGSATLLGYLRAVSRQVDFYGWDTATWKSWQIHAMQTGRRLLRE